MTTISLHDEHRHWKSDIEPYQVPSLWKSRWQLINTVIPFALLWCAAYMSLSVSAWLTILLTIPASGFLVRMFIIFHDCGHHSFFKSRRANDLVGIFTGLLVFFPYHRWKYEHSVHHAGNGNLSRRGTGDIKTLTVDEYLSLSLLRRTLYRLYRNPFVMFGLGPIFVVLILYRFNRRGAHFKERLYTHLTTLVLTGLTALLGWGFGWGNFLLVEGPILYFSGMFGIWLFYVQHQFEYSYFEEPENWDYVSAALRGSSFYKLPKVLQWITGNIGFHHIHHLGPRIPNYNLQPLYEQVTYLQEVPTIDIRTSLQCLKHRIWDEDSKRFVGYKGIVSRHGVRMSTDGINPLL